MTMWGCSIKAHAIPISSLLLAIEGQLDRPLVDRTNLTGLFNVELKWSRGDDPSASSIFTAVQEQLGLRLVATRGETNVLIVVSAERPTPD